MNACCAVANRWLDTGVTVGVGVGGGVWVAVGVRVGVGAAVAVGVRVGSGVIPSACSNEGRVVVGRTGTLRVQAASPAAQASNITIQAILPMGHDYACKRMKNQMANAKYQIGSGSGKPVRTRQHVLLFVL